MSATRHWLMYGLIASFPLLASAAGDEPLPFVRVHVPLGKVREVELGTERYVPMSAREFEAAVSRLGRLPGTENPLHGASPLLDVVRYEAAVTAGAGASTVSGTATWTSGAAMAALPALPLGNLQVDRARINTAAGTGDALVYGRADGTLAIAMPEPGTVSCVWRCGVDRGGDGQAVIHLPLVPALASTIRLQLPPGLRPVVTAAVVTPVAAQETDFNRGGTWLIEVGPRQDVAIGLSPLMTPEARTVPRLTSWTAIGIVGRQARVRAILQPDRPWESLLAAPGEEQPPVFSLRKDPRTVVTAVRLHEPPPLAATPRWRESADGTEVTIWVPVACVGRPQAFAVEGVAPFEPGQLEPLPLLRVADEAWRGGGVAVEVDATQVVSTVRLEQAAVVAFDDTARWPIPPVDVPSAPGVEPARMYIEEQGPQARVRMALARRVADVSVQRVTVVDVSPDVVLARATCDVRVRQGETFEVRGRITQGWFIDSVEVISAPVRPPLASPQADTIADIPEWKVVREGDQSEVRVAFATAVTPARPLILQITGHRGGVTPGAAFTAAELDMVRLDGETLDPVLAVKTGPEMTVDTTTAPEPVVVEDPRLALLLDDGGIRLRLPAGRRAADRVLRLARRRPPLDVATQVRLTSRDGRLVESFTFECTPDRNEIDAVVVHFSTMMDDRLEWSLLPPATGTLVARRIETADRRDSGVGESVADSWVVELSPPARQAVTIRAACTIAFPGPVPVPLAWVDGAIRNTGLVTVREAGRYRPRVVNHRLDELPPRDDAADQGFATVAEFSYDAGRQIADDLVPAAELVPGGGEDDARAWAGREETAVWCHASGAAEYETRFSIENQGRAEVAFTLPVGLQMQGAFIDGQRVPIAARGTGGGDVTIELPSGRRSLELVVRALAVNRKHAGWWQVEIQGGTLDVPVLHREVRVLLAPDVEIAQGSATHRLVADPLLQNPDWLQRLCGVRLRSSGSPPGGLTRQSGFDSGRARRAGKNLDDGYREYRLVPMVSRRDGGGILLIHKGMISSAAIVAAAVVLAVVLMTPSAVGWLVPCLGVLAALGALWVAPPFEAVCRAAWWAVLAGAAVRSSRRPAGGQGARLVGMVVGITTTLFLPAAATAEPLPGLFRVFLTPVDAGADSGTMALVPEPLFRQLSRLDAVPAAVRVVTCTLTVDPSPGPDAAEEWRMLVDVDADAGGVLLLDQRGSGAQVFEARVDGRPVALRDGAGAVGVALVDGGRHRVECRIAPAVVRRGQIDIMTVAVPVAPRSSVMLADEIAAVAECDFARVDGLFVPARAAMGDAPPGGRFDTARAAMIRVVRPIDPRLRLTSTVRRAESRNDLLWDLDGCRVSGTFAIDLPNEILRSFVIRLQPGAGLASTPAGWRLEPDDGGGCDVVPLGDWRYLVERRLPQAGPFAARLSLRATLPDPVGVFGMPGAWIEAASAESRLTQVVPAADLVADARLPDNAVAAPRDADSPLQSIAWRTEVVRGEGFDPMSRPHAGGTLTVRRRPPDLRATQRLAMDFAGDQIGMQLSARIDAGATPLVTTAVDVPVDAVIDRIDLVEERDVDADSAARRPVDMCWTRTHPGRAVIVVQQPRGGRFRLEVEVRVMGRVSNRGTVAVLRADAAGQVPLAVTWTTRDGRGLAVAPAFSEAIGEESGGFVAGPRRSSGSIELVDGENAIQYERGGEPATPADGAADTTVAAGAEDDPTDKVRPRRVELADATVVVDPRGRCWGAVRFDIVATESTLRLAVPAGLRLFETLVDGRPTPVKPCDDGTWEMSLLATAWPRSLLVVFAGETATPAGTGKPFEIKVPFPVGFPCGRMLWTVWAPGDDELRVAAPARVVDAAFINEERMAASERLVGDFGRAAEATTGVDRQRREEFMAIRRVQTLLPAERARIPATASGVTAVLSAVVDEPMDDDGHVRGLTVRVGRRPDPTVRNRALATLFVVAVSGIFWRASRRRTSPWPPAGSAVLLAGGLLLGTVWILIFDPSWPGWMILLACLTKIVPRLRPARGIPVGEESTITQFAPPASVAPHDPMGPPETVVRPQ